MKRISLLLVFALFFLTNISAQKYMGVDNPSQNPSCSSSYCHESVFSIWETSGHANAHPVESDHYGYSCLKCHTTGWDENVDNFGADEFVSQAEGQTPDYVVTAENQADWNARVNVQCEACHGPVGDDDGILDWNHTNRATDYSAENCGKCHEGAHHPYYDEWQQSAHASGHESFPFSRANFTADCIYCHHAQDFVAFLEDPDYDGRTFQPEGDLVDITCVTCHDSHSGQIRELPEEFAGKTICDVCHTVHEEEIDFNDAPHHNTSEVLSNSPNFGWQYKDEDYSQAQTFHTLIRERCVACHVHSSDYDATTGTAITGHTFAPRTEACAEACHTDYYDVVDTTNQESKFDFRGVQTATKAMWNDLGEILMNASSEDSTTDTFKKALYNYLAVEQEGSWGIHNRALVQKLLQDAIQRMTVTSIDDNDIVPTDYVLSQNYPNPFNPSTRITFSIPENSSVTLKVYDTLGKEIAVLADDNFSAGSYNVTWNASSLSSGVYFYKLESNSFVEIKKMLLLK